MQDADRADTRWALGLGADVEAHRDAGVIEQIFRAREALREDVAIVMRYAIALYGSFFNARRMLQEYVLKAYGADAVRKAPAAPLHSPGASARPA